MTDELDKNQNNSDSEDLSCDDAPTAMIGEHELGFAGGIAKAFINSPVTPMLLVATLLIGIMGLIFTPRQEDPQISVPMIDIFVSYPGTSAEQVESLVTDPLERLMDEIPGVRHVYSATQRGNAIVTVQFYVGEDLGESIVKVTDKLASNMDLIPPDVMMPLVKPVAIDDVPTLAVTLWSKEVDDSTLRILGNDVLQELGQVKQTVEELKAKLEDELGIELKFKFGTMVETVRACTRARQLASSAEFFSFGTNDLTQAVFSFSREDAENKFLPMYNESGILQDNPFEVLDVQGVGQLIEMTVKNGREVREDLKIGICGEQGGHPETIRFCHHVGLNYVSCSGPRVPIARLAAAVARLRASDFVGVIRPAA